MCVHHFRVRWFGGCDFYSRIKRTHLTSTRTHHYSMEASATNSDASCSHTYIIRMHDPRNVCGTTHNTQHTQQTTPNCAQGQRKKATYPKTTSKHSTWTIIHNVEHNTQNRTERTTRVSFNVLRFIEPKSMPSVCSFFFSLENCAMPTRTFLSCRHWHTMFG